MRIVDADDYTWIDDMADRRKGLLALGVEQIKQYPGPQQVELKVEVEVPGSWFGLMRRVRRGRGDVKGSA